MKIINTRRPCLYNDERCNERNTCCKNCYDNFRDYVLNNTEDKERKNFKLFIERK